MSEAYIGHRRCMSSGSVSKSSSPSSRPLSTASASSPPACSFLLAADAAAAVSAAPAPQSQSQMIHQQQLPAQGSSRATRTIVCSSTSVIACLGCIPTFISEAGRTSAAATVNDRYHPISCCICATQGSASSDEYHISITLVHSRLASHLQGVQ
jgi:hypothetical protein